MIVLAINVLGYLYNEENQNKLKEYSNRILEDISYSNGKFDIQKYNSDPLTPLPYQSGQIPLYIISNQGFVIERNQPIENLLDTSSYSYWLEFLQPRTVKTITGESWRVLAVEIKSADQSLGVIVVSIHLGEESVDQTEIDQILHKDAESLLTSLKIEKSKFSIADIDIRNTHFKTSFEIVDVYNKVLLNNGRTPSYIDTSYISKEIKTLGFKKIVDIRTNNSYLIYSSTIKDSDGEVVAVIVVGERITEIDNIMSTFVIILSISGLVLALIFTVLFNKLHTDLNSQGVEDKVVHQIKLNLDENILYIDGTQIDIPYSSNQYYLAKALLSKPTKKWELDELFAITGEDVNDSNYRKYYDTVIALNKKVGIKLFEYKDRIYRINPKYLDSIVR
jgi:hypothetical protein